MVTIRVDFARARLVDSAKSEVFVNEIRKLQDTLSFSPGRADDRPRYPPRTIDALARDLLARGPALRDLVFQLAHLLRAAAALAPSGSALEVLFTLEGPAHPRVIARGLAPWLEGRGDVGHLDADALHLPYGEGSHGEGRAAYEIPLGRLPALLALLEFVLGLDLPETGEGATRPARDRAVRDCETCEARFEAQRTASNALARVLAAYLDGVLGGRAARERLIALTRYLDETAEEAGHGAPALWRIDDAAVLGFWESRAAAAGSGGGEMRQFRTVHRAFVALILALRHGRDWHALHGAPLGLDAGADPEEPGRTATREVADGAQEALWAGEAPESPLARLAEPPLDGIKFLNKAETEALELIDLYWRPCLDLPRSVLRSAVMGRRQSALTTARQFGRRSAPAAAGDPPDDAAAYAAQRAAWHDMLGHLERMRLASAHVYAHHAGITLPARAQEARRAFQGFRRAGFAGALDDPGRGAAFGAAIAPLLALSEAVTRLDRALPADLDALEAADRARFDPVFRLLYAETEAR